MKFYIKVALFISLFNFSSITSADMNKNAKLFGSWPDILDVVISPNGKYVGVVQIVNRQGIVKILDFIAPNNKHS